MEKLPYFAAFVVAFTIGASIYGGLNGRIQLRFGDILEFQIEQNSVPALSGAEPPQLEATTPEP